MKKYNLRNLFYSVTVSCICSFLSGVAMLYFIIAWLLYLDINDEPERLFVFISVPFFVGILPALSYNLIRFRMVKSGELNYGMWRFAISTVLPFIAPMLIYGIAYLNGFRL